jgi:polar amino acid transport system ATP-binding protein
VLLYDEPTSALDPSLKSEVADALRRVRASGVTQLVVTHDATLVDGAGDVRFTLRGGTLQPPAA